MSLGHVLTAHKWLSVVLLIGGLVLGMLLWQVLYITSHYTASVLAPNIPRRTENFGSSGPLLNYAVLGDSTAIAQGASYDQGVARQSAHWLAQTYRVQLTNYGVSGARVRDVLGSQAAKAAANKPDLVLIAVGANDVTHLTALTAVRVDMTKILTILQSANPGVKIVLSGSPAMGSVSRFAPPTQWLASLRVHQVNSVLAQVAASKHVVLVPLASQTAATFKHNPQLFAPDNFHPNAAGYAVWLPIIEGGIDRTGLAHN